MKQWIFSGLLVVVAMVSICSLVMAEEPPPQITCPKGYHPVGNRCVPN